MCSSKRSAAARSLISQHSCTTLSSLVQVYVWGRRHPYVHLNFLGLFNFTAPYLPWVLLAFSVTLRSNAVVDLLGIVAGALPNAQWCSSHCIL